MVLLFMPTYCSEINPIESLWAWVKQQVKLKMATGRAILPASSQDQLEQFKQLVVQTLETCRSQQAKTPSLWTGWPIATSCRFAQHIHSILYEHLGEVENPESKQPLTQACQELQPLQNLQNLQNP